MTSVFYEWAAQWGVSEAAVRDLQERLGVLSRPQADGPHTGSSETDTQQRLILGAACEGWHLTRNNVGAGVDAAGRPVRFGLWNESKRVNEHLKSSDLIGIRRRQILPEHVGGFIGQFVAREVKRPGWVYAGTPRERAQRAFLEMIAAQGGDAKFTTGEL